MYDCIVVGGGIAGLQAAIQLGRYRHRVLVIDKGRGRSTLCRSYHNVLGWPDGVSGQELRHLGRQHAERLGVEFRRDEAVAVARNGRGFQIALADGGGAVHTETLLAATGVLDRFPPLPGLEERLGISVYVCPDCDGYEVRGKRTVVMGSGDTGAGMALALRYWTDRIIYVNHERQAVGSGHADKLMEAGIPHVEAEIAEVIGGADARFDGVRLSDGRTIEGERGFIAFGGNEVHTGWTAALGIERLENRHIVTDPRTKMTNVPGVWAAGDIGVHSEQVTIAMGEGSQAAIWIHKELLKRKTNTAVFV
ncbi:NAD(P)/FAD-dependent oxidoreductase [Paenibacillus tyrfis]|uniref:Pyridine nucleotide-disulfide oxidoreductase n=1 Tax=Paenibacillus tyrfis TaxID=1501230 RepID=A0A081NZS9_9BACL|nr:NAD(P)/FAD-dependent oxidoreductase [Paenibacillus tyrfis]KEQ23952.1 pyridine nucleotide-disulfide oxidoreductase [Paenibacillus tyrfis]